MKKSCLVPSLALTVAFVEPTFKPFKVKVMLFSVVRIGDYLKGDKGYRVFNYHDYEGFKDAVSELMMSKDTVNYNQLLAPFDKEKIREEYCRIYNC
jgi:hypothetical protein